MAAGDTYGSPFFRLVVVTRIDQLIRDSGLQLSHDSGEMENQIFMKAKTNEEYSRMVAKLVSYLQGLSQANQNQGAPTVDGPNQNQPGLNPDDDIYFLTCNLNQVNISQ